MTEMSKLLLLGGVIHFGILIASALAPQVLAWREQLAKLDRLTRQLVWVHGAFIVLVIVMFGAASLAFAGPLASGDTASRVLCGMISLFWLARLAVQFWVFDASGYLRTMLLRVGYHSLTVAFVYLAVVYGWAAIRPAA
jgi:hypothetical protein